MSQKKVLCSSCVHLLPSRCGEGRHRIDSYQRPRSTAPSCSVHAPQGFDHPDRIRYPLKRAGPRGSSSWQQVSWNDARDDIAARLKNIISTYGPKSLVVSESPWNIQTDSGTTRRFS
jgi:anaerobic selenocysteine-containing dehydrogenase